MFVSIAKDKHEKLDWYIINIANKNTYHSISIYHSIP